MRAITVILICFLIVSCNKYKPIVTVFKNGKLPRYDRGKLFYTKGGALAPIVMFPGQGYNSVTGERMAAVVIDTPLTTVFKSDAEKHGQHVELKFTLIESFESLRQSMSIDITASLKMGVFKGRNELSLLESSSFNYFSIFYLVSMTVVNPSLSLASRNWKLTDEARNLIRDSATFTRSFGDEFVTSIETGGSLYILLEFKTTSKDDRKRLRNILNASVKSIVGRGQIDAKIENEFQQIQYTKSQNVYFSGTGICDSIPSFELPDLIKYIRGFPDKVSLDEGCPSVLNFSTAKISVLPEIPDSSKNMFDVFIRQRHFLQACAFKKDSLLALKGNIKYIKENEGEFSNINETQLVNAETSVENNLRTINRIVQDCSENTRFCDKNLLEEILVTKIDFNWSKGDANPQDAYKDILVNKISFVNPQLLDSIGFSGIKTIELRGAYGFNYWGVANGYVYNDPSQEYTFRHVITGEMITLDATVGLTLKIVDKLGTVVTRIQYYNTPIEINKSNVYIYLEPYMSSAVFSSIDQAIRYETVIASKGLDFFKVKENQPLHVLIH
jgi:hypothetical protein